MKSKKNNFTPFEIIVDKINDTKYNNFNFCATYKYNTVYACHDDPEICANDYCRCGVIENAHITKVNLNIIVDILTTDYDSDIWDYCVDRVVRLSGILDFNNWEANIVGGYYGQEVSGALLSTAVKDELVNKFTELNTLDDAGKIKKLLEYEYGYVLPRLQNLNNVEFIESSIDRIELCNDSYLKKISKDTVDFYTDYRFPRAVCIMTGYDKFGRGIYSVIDGYHRLLSAKNNKKNNIDIIVLSA